MLNSLIVYRLSTLACHCLGSLFSRLRDRRERAGFDSQSGSYFLLGLFRTFFRFFEQTGNRENVLYVCRGRFQFGRENGNGLTVT